VVSVANADAIISFILKFANDGVGELLSVVDKVGVGGFVVFVAAVVCSCSGFESRLKDKSEASVAKAVAIMSSISKFTSDAVAGLEAFGAKGSFEVAENALCDTLEPVDTTV